MMDNKLLQEVKEEMPEMLKSMTTDAKRQLLHLWMHKQSLVDDITMIIESDMTGK